MWVKSKLIGRFPASLGLSVLLLIVGLVFSADARAATIYVDDACGNDSWSGSTSQCTATIGPKKTIQEGIDAAAPGDTVLVADGTYTENINFNSKEITIQSENGAASTTITADVSGTSVVTFSDNLGNGAVIDGFTITNGSAAVGGGIICGDSSSPIIRNCVIDSNEATGEGGGGIGIGESASPTITSCTISNNTAVNASPPSYIMGGGIHCAPSSSPEIKNCKFINNAANYGGAIAANTASPTITNCTFNGNTATDTGGAISCTSSSTTVRNSIFWEDLEAGATGGELRGDTYTVSYSDVQQSGYAGSNGNINSDPLFVDTTNYYLQINSPCWDAGDPSAAYNDDPPYTSVDGVRNDMGVYGGPDGVQDSTDPAITTASATPMSGNAPLGVSFTGAATDEWGIASYAWDFGDGDSSSEASPNHTYDNCGGLSGYTATLTVTDNSGHTSSATVGPITVGGTLPTATASADPIAAIATSESVIFSGSATGGTGSYSWSWTFGDGDTSALQNPGHTYTTPGTYTPTLSVTDSSGCWDASDAVDVTIVSSACSSVEYALEVSATAIGTVEVEVPGGSTIAGTKVAIPPGVLSQDTVIAISKITSPPALPGAMIAIGTPVDFAPDGASFTPNVVTITLPYTDAEVTGKGGNENDLKIYFYNGSNWQEELTNKVIDTINNTVSIDVDHFSFFRLAFGPPTPPSNLLAAGVSDIKINLQWTDNSSDETGFKIERKTGVLSYTQIDTVVAGVLVYEDSGLNSDTEYCYKVRAYNAYGDSAYSNEQCVKTQETHTAGIDWVAREDNIILTTDRPYHDPPRNEITAKIVYYDNYIYVASSEWNGTDYDYLVIKYSATGTETLPALRAKKWSQTYAGSAGNNDIAIALAVNATGVYVTGKSMNDGAGSEGGNTFPGHNAYIIPNYDWVTVKYNFSGVEQWAKTFNGVTGTITVSGGANGNTNGDANGDNDNNDADDFPPHDVPADIAVDAAGNVYVTGKSYQCDRRHENDEGGGTAIYSLISGYDYATIKYDTNGNEAWTGPAGVRTFDGIIPWLNGLGYYSDGNGGDFPAAVKVDSSGDVYVTGASSFEEIITSESLGDQTGLAYNQLRLGSGADAPCGGGVGCDDYYNDMAISTSEGGLDITLTITDYVGTSKIATVAPGYLLAPGYLAHPTSAGLYVITKDDPEGNYVTIKYNSSGTRQWAVGYDRAGFADEPQDMVVDSSGNVYVTGKSRNSNLDFDYATVKYNSSGTEQWVKTYDGTAAGDSKNDEALRIVINGPDNVYVTGENVYITGTAMENDVSISATLGSQGLPSDQVRFGIEADTACPGVGLQNDCYNNLTLEIAGATPSWVTITGYNATTRIATVTPAYSVPLPSAGAQYTVAGQTENYVTIAYKPDGTYLWPGETAKYNGPDGGSDQAYALAVDESGIYVTGSSNASYSSEEVEEGLQDLNNYLLNIKYDLVDGSEVWANPVRYNVVSDFVDLNGNLLDDRWELDNKFGYNGTTDITVDDSGNAYVVGIAYLGTGGTHDTLFTIKDAPGQDMDNDGLDDEWEADYGLITDPFGGGADGDNGADGDPDGDGLTNLQEYALVGTDPTNLDTDEDGMDDGWEWDNGLDPLLDDADIDADGDGYSNLTEYNNGTNPQVASKVYYVNAVTGAGITCSAASPCATIEKGIDKAVEEIEAGGTDIKVSVSAGTYSVTEDVVIPTNVKLIGERWYDCTIDLGAARQIRLGSYTTLRGFTITNPSDSRHMVFAQGVSSATITNNVIHGNPSYVEAEAPAAIFLDNSSGSIENNTIDGGHTGIRISYASADASIVNNIIVNAKVALLRTNDATVSADYNNLWGNTTDYAWVSPGDNDIPGNPIFVDAAGGNYHLQKVRNCADIGSSPASPCIDTGDPSYKDKDGSLSDMGADGGPQGTAADTTVPGITEASADYLINDPAPLNVDFTGEADDEWGIACWSWDFDTLTEPQEDSTTQNPSHTYDTCGGYIAKLTVTDHSGNSSSATTGSISVDSDTVATASAVPIAVIVGNSIAFTGNASGTANSFSYSWDFDYANGIQQDSTGQNPSHTYTTPGNYRATLTVTDDFGCQTPATVPVTIVAGGSNNPTICQAQEVAANTIATLTVSGTGGKADGVAVEIPATALSEKTVITISELNGTLPDLPPGNSGITLAVDFGPDGAAFSTPVTITIPYTYQDLLDAGDGITPIDPSELKVYYYDTGTSTWVEIPVTNVTGDGTNPADSFIYAQTTHFTTYTLAAGAPTPPTGLTATAVSSSRINLSWTDTSSDEDDFSIERKTGIGGTYVEIDTTEGPNVTSYSDTGLSASTEYWYRVLAVKGGEYSGYSNETSASTPASSSKSVGGSGGGGGGGGGGCFIATAAYGTPMARQVRILSLFRDEYLLNNALGRRFVAFYCKYSPPIAEYIAQREFLRKLVRIALWPLIWFGLFMLKAGLAGKIGFGIILLLAGGCLLTLWGCRQSVGAPSRRDMP